VATPATAVTAGGGKTWTPTDNLGGSGGTVLRAALAATLAGCLGGWRATVATGGQGANWRRRLQLRHRRGRGVPARPAGKAALGVNGRRRRLSRGRRQPSAPTARPATPVSAVTAADGKDGDTTTVVGGAGGNAGAGGVGGSAGGTGAGGQRR